MNNSSNDSHSANVTDDFTSLLLLNSIVYRGYFFFLIIAGTCGNLLTAITLLRAKLRKYTTCQFMAVCALLNIGVLLTHTLHMMLSHGHDIHLRSIYDLGWCRFHAFLSQWIRGMASWILVIVAFDRFRQSKTIRRTTATKSPIVFHTMLIASVILIVLNFHYLLYTGSRVSLDGNVVFLACIFHKESPSRMQRFFASTSTWQELVTIIIVPCILTLILNIFIIKNSFLNPIANEHLKSRSKSRTRRVTTMLLASNIGFLALVAPAQIFYALRFDPLRRSGSASELKSFIIQGSIYQCLINTYYAASFVFCFASSSVFRREIKKLLQKRDKNKHGGINRAVSLGACSSHENHPFIQPTQISQAINSSTSRINELLLERTTRRSTYEDEPFN